MAELQAVQGVRGRSVAWTVPPPKPLARRSPSVGGSAIPFGRRAIVREVPRHGSRSGDPAGSSSRARVRLVTDGGSREEAAEHLGQSGDEGIDGRINQDALGLDQILVQAERYAPDRSIDRKTIQAFIGSLAGQGVSKGIFITTSSFAESAREFVQRGSQTKIVLIDGEDLLDRMMRHHVGVRVERAIELLDLDQNYFESEG